MKKQSFQCLVWFLLLWLCPPCFGQVIKIRVTDSKTRRPLQMQHVLVGLHYGQGERAPVKYAANLRLETDANGRHSFVSQNLLLHT